MFVRESAEYIFVKFKKKLNKNVFSLRPSACYISNCLKKVDPQKPRNSSTKGLKKAKTISESLIRRPRKDKLNNCA